MVKARNVKKKVVFLLACLLLGLLVALLLNGTSSAVLADEVTVTGKVNAYFQIEGEDGELYDIAMTTTGDELMRLVGARVQVIGMVQETAGNKMIVVTSYQILEENPKEAI
jgi:hypothetical protein